MGGKVEVKSKVGEGTTFTITLTSICKVDMLSKQLSNVRGMDSHRNSDQVVTYNRPNFNKLLSVN
jgi:hypothetical protein